MNRTRAWLGASLLPLWVACGVGGVAADEAAGYEAHVEAVVREAGLGVSIGTCQQVRDRRLGSCEAAGAGAGAVPAALGLTPATAQERRSWLGGSRSGCVDSGWTARHPEAHLHLRTDASHIPQPTDGRRLDRVWVDVDAACFDLQVPWS